MTEEDAKRTILYRELDQRKAFVASSIAAAASSSSTSSSSSMDAFAASLHLRIDFAPLVPTNADRAAQLTDRTNQHNACKWPIKREGLLSATEGLTAVTVDARDRFGHHRLHLPHRLAHLRRAGCPRHPPPVRWTVRSSRYDTRPRLSGSCADA